VKKIIVIQSVIVGYKLAIVHAIYTIRT